MKHKSYRERYFEDMEAVRVPAKNRKGYRIEYRYVGLWKSWENETVDRKRLQRLLPLAELAGAAVYLAGALADVGLNGYGIAGGFGTIAIVPWLLEISGVVRFALAGDYIREQSWHEIDHSIRYGCCARVVLMGLSIVCAVVQTAMSGFTAADALAAAGLIVSTLVSFLIYRQYTRLWEVTFRNRDGLPGARY